MAITPPRFGHFSGYSSVESSPDKQSRTPPSTAGVKRAVDEASPFASPTKELSSPLKKMDLRGVRLNLSDEAIAAAVKIMQLPKQFQTIADKMGEAMNDRNAEQLQMLFSQCSDFLAACCKEAIDSAFEDEDVQFFKEQLAIYLKLKFESCLATNDSKGAQKCLVVAKNTRCSFTHLLSEALQARLDIPARLGSAVSAKDMQQVEEIFHDCTIFNQECMLPNLGTEDSAWLKAALSDAKVIAGLAAGDFELIYQVFEAYKQESKVLDAELLIPLQNLHGRLLQDAHRTELAARLSRIVANTHALRTSLCETRMPTFLQALRMACFAEKMLHSNVSAVRHFPKGYEGIARDLIIDGENKNFLVLSGKAGVMATKGEERAVSNATLFTSGKTRQFVYLVNLETDRSAENIADEVERMKKQVELAQEINGDVYMAVSSKSPAGNPLFIVVEEKYASSLEPFCKPDASRLRYSQIKKLCSIISQKLMYMHARGYMHGDINRRNIVLTIDSDIQAKLIDFGCTYDPGRNLALQEIFQTSYGTDIYSAPEFFEPHQEWKIEQLQRFDMYALGCLLYELLVGREVPESHLKRRYIDGDRAHIQAQSRMYEGLVQEAESCTDPEKKELFDLCVSLLSPVPERRMTAAGLVLATT